MGCRCRSITRSAGRKTISSARTGYDIEQDWAVGSNDQPHVWNAIVVYNLPFGAEGRAGSGNPFVRAIVKDWQVSGITQFRSGRPLGSIGATCNLPNAGRCYADFNPNFSGPVRINGDYGDGDVLSTTNPPTYIDRAAFQSPAPFTFGNTPRTLAHDLRNPNYFNQDFSVRRDFHVGTHQARVRRRRVQPVQQRRVRRHPDEHHQRELRARQLAVEHAARRADQSAAGVLASSGWWLVVGSRGDHEEIADRCHVVARARCCCRRPLCPRTGSIPQQDIASCGSPAMRAVRRCTFMTTRFRRRGTRSCSTPPPGLPWWTSRRLAPRVSSLRSSRRRCEAAISRGARARFTTAARAAP